MDEMKTEQSSSTPTPTPPTPSGRYGMVSTVLYVIAVLIFTFSLYHIDSVLDAGGAYNKTVLSWVSAGGAVLLLLSAIVRWFRIQFTQVDDKRTLMFQRVRTQGKKSLWSKIGLVFLYILGILLFYGTFPPFFSIPVLF